MDLPDELLHSIVRCLANGKSRRSFRATCRKGRAAANEVVTFIKVCRMKRPVAWLVFSCHA